MSITARTLHTRAARGLSLIEACFVVLLVSLLVTVAVPGIGALLDRKRLEGSANQLVADLQWLRGEALARSEALRLTVYPHAEGSCTLVHTGLPADCRCDAGQPGSCTAPASALKTSHWPRRDGIAVTANVGSLRFDPVLGTTSPAGSLSISDRHGRSITHVVNILGRVRSCSPEGRMAGYRAC